jgi:integration host factor subunit beta
MLRSELIMLLEPEIPDPEGLLGLSGRSRIAAEILDTIFDEIVAHMAKGGRVELRGFGVFEGRMRKPRKGRNPQNGDIINVPAKFYPFFRAGKVLQDQIDPSISKN